MPKEIKIQVSFNNGLSFTHSLKIVNLLAFLYNIENDVKFMLEREN